MKKFLSLVLALVMTMSLVTVANAADFTDDASINYEEAVDVMSALGIVGGYADGSFNPTGTLTRGAAAKIICGILLTPDVAEVLKADAAPFKDVPVDNTFAGYIAYCAQEGIISGYADGTFRPAGTLTGNAFMKMLVGALGYDASIEGLTGDNWTVKMAEMVKTLKLAKGTTFVGSKAITREEACLFAFNALNTRMVGYADKGSQITINGIVISSGASAATGKWEIEPDVANGIAGDTLLLREDKFPELASNGATADDLGYVARGWQVTKAGKTTDVGTYTQDATLVYTAAVTADDMTTNLKGYIVDGTYNVPVVTNAASQTTTTIPGVTATAIAALTGNGKTVSLYIDANTSKITKIVVIAPALGTVTGVVNTAANKTHGAYTTYTITGDDTTINSGRVYSTVVNATLDVDTAVLNDAIAKKDVVTYYNGASKLYVDATSTVEGVLSAITSKGALTIDGADYKLADCGTLPSVSKTAQKFYVDSMGYIVKSYTNSTTNYAYVAPKSVKPVMVANADGTYTIADRATIVLPDGTTETVVTSTSWASYEGKVVTYTVNTKGQYVYAATAGESQAAIADDQVILATVSGNLYANDATLYVVCNYTDADEDGFKDTFTGVTTYTGYKNVPVYAGPLTKAYAVDTDSPADSIANVVFIGDESASATETGKYVYVTGNWTQVNGSVSYETIVAGQISSVSKPGLGALTADTLYTAIGTTDTAATKVGTKVQNKGGLLYIDGAYAGKSIADDVVVYTINIADDSISVGTAADLATEVNADTYTQGGTRGIYVEYNAANTAATTVYVLYNAED